MPLDSYIMIGIGGFFLLLSIIAFLWAKNEDRKLDDALCQRTDVHEFISGPLHIESGALRAGGWICMIIALVLIIMGSVFLAID